jgi:hypothetical protein
VRSEGEGGAGRVFALGLPLSPRLQPQTTRGKRFEGDILGPEKILAGHFPPLGRFLKEERIGKKRYGDS